MSDNRIISRNKYMVYSVTSSTTDNKLTKNPYTANPTYPEKKTNASNSFDNSLHSVISHTSSNDNSSTFSNELENMQRLKSEENSRLVQARFNKKSTNISNSSKSTTETELHNNLSEAMNIEVDISSLYEKIEMLNSLKNKPNN